MEAKSFPPDDIVGGSCTYERRDRANSTEVIPLLTVLHDHLEITGHVKKLKAKICFYKAF